MNEYPTNPEREPEPEKLHPRIWIGSLADYNNGRLLGDWVDAAVDTDTMSAAIQAVLARSREPAAEEWGIFDYDEFGGYRVGEYDDLDVVTKVARGIQQHGPAFAAWADLVRSDNPDLLRSPEGESDESSFGGEFAAFTTRYLGSYATRADWAEEMATDLAGDVEASIPDWLRPYVRIDWDAFARDSSLGGEFEFVTHSDGVWVFDGRQ